MSKRKAVKNNLNINARKKSEKSYENKYPKNYFSLFGSINDFTLKVERE